MKRIILMTAVIVLAVYSASLYGAEKPKDAMNKSFATLMFGLQNGNKGLTISCALTLGEYRFENAVPALADILNSDNDSEVKFAAMFALYRIRTSDAVKALESAAKNFGSPLRTAAEILYTDIMRDEDALAVYGN